MNTLSHPQSPEIKKFLEKIQEYVKNRIIWLLQDLERSEGTAKDKVSHIEAAIERILSSIKRSIGSPSGGSEDTITLREHIQKMSSTLGANARFSPKTNSHDRAFVITLIHYVLGQLGIQGIHCDSSGSRRLIVHED